MYLLIDWGNSHLKYLLVDDVFLLANSNDYIPSVQIARSCKELINSCEETLQGGKIKRVLIASVRNEKDNQELIQLISNKNWPYFIAETQSEACGVKCAYPAPSKLGIDRWLCILAVYSKGHRRAIIDIGTAIKLDIVDEKGVHLGGQIVPGKRLLEKAVSFTGRIDFEHSVETEEVFNLGLSTDECVSFGIKQLIASYLSSIVNLSLDLYRVDSLVFTGGGAKYWLEQIEKGKINLNNELSEVKQLTLYNSGLVFKGLTKLYIDNQLIIQK